MNGLPAGQETWSTAAPQVCADTMVPPLLICAVKYSFRVVQCKSHPIVSV